MNIQSYATLNTKPLNNQLTIVIPSKNEGVVLYNCIMYLYYQNNIDGVRVIIADVSDDMKSISHILRLKKDFKDRLKIEVIEGGFPSVGRLNGSKLVTTPYMLFLDSDIYLTNRNIIDECMEYKKGLVTVPFYTDKPHKWVFRLFDIFQNISIMLGTPFAVGGFQLWNTKMYWELGGYNPEELFAEDYSLSQKVNKNDFKIHRNHTLNGAYTSNRRFKNKGVLWMFKIMLKSYINRKNPKFFRESHGYWN